MLGFIPGLADSGGCQITASSQLLAIFALNILYPFIPSPLLSPIYVHLLSFTWWWYFSCCNHERWVLKLVKVPVKL